MKTLLLLLIIATAISPICIAQDGQEVVSERSLYSKMFLNDDGSKEQIISIRPVHYQVKGEWLPIDNNLVLKEKNIVNLENSIQSSFPSVMNSESVVELEYEGSKISIEALKQIVTYSELNGVEKLNLPFNGCNGSVTANQVSYDNLYNGYTDKFTVSAGEIKNDFTINSITQELANLNDGHFGFQERFVLPQNWSLEPMIVQNTDLIHSAIKIMDDENNHVLTIPAPIFYDHGGIANDGSSMVEGAFIIDKDEQGWLLSTVVPVSWLNDPFVTYPVVIDPSVVLGGATGGWQSQNNYVNNPGFVFIGVCCGNMEHRAWVQFNTTSIDDASCVTDVEMQVYVNGVGGAASELVHAYDMTGAFGPYGAIMPAVYTDMGNGYYTSFSITGVGYYGYYNLGASAAALLQTQLTTMNAFQVAMIFDNEPSTNWKRLTAGLCNLRVSYDAPPCGVLPVGMTNFETKCKDDQAQLSWSTVTESNSDYFTIWKSIDGQQYEEVGQVKTNGNSSSTLNYRWVDQSENNESAYYKITQTDLDGTIQDFDAKLFRGCDDSEPVVFIDDANDIRIRGNNIISAIFYDNMGRVITDVLNKGDQNELTVSSDGFITGLYSATVTYDNGKQKPIKFMFSKD